MKNLIHQSIDDAIKAISQLYTPQSIAFIEGAARQLADAFRNGSKVITAGNGGSLCDAAHLAEELTGFFRRHRPALSALVLNDPGHLTCVGNDLGFEWVFARGVEAHGRQGDIFIGLTTSGNSPNIVRAFETAKTLGLTTIAFLGKGGGKLKGIADLELCIDGFQSSDRIQEAHMAAIHMMIEGMEHLLYPITVATPYEHRTR